MKFINKQKEILFFMNDKSANKFLLKNSRQQLTNKKFRFILHMHTSLLFAEKQDSHQFVYSRQSNSVFYPKLSLLSPESIKHDFSHINTYLSHTPTHTCTLLSKLELILFSYLMMLSFFALKSIPQFDCWRMWDDGTVLS